MVTAVTLCSNLPMPLIYLHSAEDLAQWQISQLSWAYEQGQRDVSLSCFDTLSMGFPLEEAAPILWDAVQLFLRERPDVASLTVLCGDVVSFCTYFSLAEGDSK